MQEGTSLRGKNISAARGFSYQPIENLRSIVLTKVISVGIAVFCPTVQKTIPSDQIRRVRMPVWLEGIVLEDGSGEESHLFQLARNPV